MLMEKLSSSHSSIRAQVGSWSKAPSSQAKHPKLPRCANSLRNPAIAEASVTRSLGTWRSEFEGQVWAFSLVEPRAVLADSWLHDAPDDGGLRLRFFWHRLRGPLGNEWHPLFQGAIRFLQSVA